MNYQLTDLRKKLYQCDLIR